MIKQKFLSLFVALVATTNLFASNNKVGSIWYDFDAINLTASVTYRGSEFSDYDEYTGSVVIPASVYYNRQTYSVTSIGLAAFCGCSGLTSVTIPNSVTKIGSMAFYGCSGLTSITIPNSVTIIEDMTFYECSGLTSVTIPNSVTSIGGAAFDGCTGLTSVTIPNSVKTIKWMAFEGCTGLTSITIPNSVTTIEECAFRDCYGLTSVTIPNSVTSIGYNAFSLVNNIVYSGTATGSPWGAKCVNGYVDGYLVYSDATKTTLCGCFTVATGAITIPNSVTTIGEYAFYNCSGLTSVTIPSSITTIEIRTFSGCSGLTSVTIPSSVTTIGLEAFYNCTGLTSITIPNSVTTIEQDAFKSVINIVYSGTATWGTEDTYWTRKNPYWGAKCLNGYVDGCLVYRDATKTELCGCSTAAIGEVSIPNSVTTIGKSAFEGCTGLTSITIPNSVTTIEECAFRDCYGLTSVTIPNSVTTIGECAFLDCSSLTSVTIPNSVTTIGAGAFYGCTRLSSITIPNSVTEIGENAFYGCTSIKKVCVSSSYPFEDAKVSSIIANAFTSSAPQYILQYEAQISTDDATPTCAFVHVDLSKMKTSQYAQMALDFAGTKYELSTKESTVVLTGLTPASTNQATFYSQLIGESEWREGATIEVTPPALTLTTLTPKVVSAGTAIVAAETNISDYETNVGFEWRKFDAPSTMPSKSGAAVIYNGMMEGKLLNLGTDSYWNVRPYYEAADGTRYYGEWITFDPSDFSYFEPTVHTYALATSPTSNKVQVRGYVMTGTDEVTEQGFEYWIKNAKVPNRMHPNATDGNSDIIRVQASGQVMTAVLEDLAYSTTYTCRAYAVAGGKTYYGEEVQFLTPEEIIYDGLEDVWVTPVQSITKFIYNNQLYIFSNGKMYNAAGVEL